MEPLRKELAEGVFLTYVPAAKFKTGVLGAQLITPLEESTVAAGALLPAVLRRELDVRCAAAADVVHALHKGEHPGRPSPTPCARRARINASALSAAFLTSVMSPAESGCSNRWPTCSASCCSTRSRGTGAS